LWATGHVVLPRPASFTLEACGVTLRAAGYPVWIDPKPQGEDFWAQVAIFLPDAIARQIHSQPGRARNAPYSSPVCRSDSVSSPGAPGTIPGPAQHVAAIGLDITIAATVRVGSDQHGATIWP